jgi:hypothetical protein
MDIGIYRQCLEQYVREALQNSDGTPAGITEYLNSIKVSGIFVRNKIEKRTALREAINAFEQHRHWPLEIVISQLGVEIKKPSPPA